MKKFALVVILLFSALTLPSSALIINVLFQSAPIPAGKPRPIPPSDFNEVIIKEYPDRCTLECKHIGSKKCEWANATWCTGCSSYQILFDNSNVDEMNDHAKDQIDLGVDNGSYSSQLIHEGITYYRTVIWELDEELDEYNISVSVTYED